MKASLRVRLFQHDTHYYRYITGGLWLVTAAWAVMLALGMPTGIGKGFDLTMIALLHAACSIVLPVIIALLLQVLKLPIPMFMTGYMFYASIVIFSIMYNGVRYDVLASSILTIVSLLIGVIGGLFVAFLTDSGYRSKLRIIGLIAACCIGLLLWLRPHVLLSQLWSEEEASGTAAFSEVTTLSSLGISNPSLKGSYAIHSFTYGSGTDKHRPEFGADASIISQTVDASAYIHRWPLWRTIFWGFDESALPLNGRVWMPAGDGEFPLVLIVHGNHTMEMFSDDGYAYLGELLASRGMIAVSVDQNFFNYSHWSGIPNDNYKLRTWLLLQHIQELARLNEQPDNPFYGKVDLHNIAMIGHSRGGQAVAMAADAERWFADDQSLPDASTYEIQAVIAIAPTDVQVDKQEAVLTDLYYLTLYGGKDADVNTLKGDEQYSRVKINDPDRFRSTLFIEAANHTFFNSSWGPNDLELPSGFFLNQRDTMSRQAQETVAKLYISALLEIVFHDKREYVPLFRDHRTAGDWLPDESRYANRYGSGGMKLLADFERLDSVTVAPHDSVIRTEGLTVWEAAPVKDKNGTNKGTRGAVLQWSDEATLTIMLSDEYRRQLQAANLARSVLSFSYMNAAHDLATDEGTSEHSARVPEIFVELVNVDGETRSVPLSAYTNLSPMSETTYTIIPLLEDRMRKGKYRNKRTLVFQTVEIPLGEDEFMAERLESITFRFSSGPARIILDDIGFAEDVQ